jgi:hypothetical protein
MDQDDPEKRIADLERQLSEPRPAGEPGASWSSQAAPAWTPYPPPPQAAQPASPPPFNWEQPAQAPAYSFPTAPARNRGPRIALILLSTGIPVLILLVVGIFAVSSFHHATRHLLPPTAPAQQSAGSPPASKGSGPSATGPTQLLTADGLNGLFAQIRGKFGDTMGFQLTVYPDYAVLDRAEAQNSQHKKGYYYKGGSWSDFGPTEHVSSFDSLVDLAKFDVAAVTAKMASAPQALNVPNPTSTYLIVQGWEGGSTRIAIYESGNGDDGYMDVNPDGSVKALHPQT